LLHTLDLSPWKHEHVFDRGNPLGEKNTWRVVALTATMMVVEITTGWLFNSMALLADGWHMSTHVAALGLTAAAYLLARRYASDTRFAFGTWKIEILGGFASAIVLAMVALYMAAESVQRFFQPLDIHYNQALLVALIGLLVNLASAVMLKDHGHGHHHHHGQLSRGHGDLNLRAAYVHVLADATTSVLAIVALLGGKFLDWAWLDPAMGIVGAGVITAWSYGLLRDTSRVLLDREMDHEIVREIREALESDADTRITDLHVWRVGRAQFACLVSIVAGNPKTPGEYKDLLRDHEEIVHVTVEVMQCPNHVELPAFVRT
jgi:cation diffusion facilitator family transporter